MNTVDHLTNAEVARAEAAGVAMHTLVVPRDAAGELLDGAYTRGEGGWTYTGKMLSDGMIRSFSGLVMSPFACRALDNIADGFAQARSRRVD